MLIWTSVAWAQVYEGRACDCRPTSSGFPTSVATDGYPGDLQRNASSCLAAAKTKVVPGWGEPGAPQGDEDSEAWEQQRMAYVDHTCRYSAHHLEDGDPKTAWCEGVAGPGIGQVAGVVLGSEVPKTLEIVVGFGKSPALWAANHRPKRVRVHLKVGSPQAAQATLFVEDLKLVGTLKWSWKTRLACKPLLFLPCRTKSLGAWWLLSRCCPTPQETNTTTCASLSSARGNL